MLPLLYSHRKSPRHSLYKRLGGPGDGDDLEETRKNFRKKKVCIRNICISVYNILLGTFWSQYIFSELC